jgi:hypothetical protein
MAQIKRPYPLFTAPMRDIWQGHARQEYTIFVDESFRRFLKMTEEDSRYGYFSYGGVGVPTAEYAPLRITMAPIIGDYLKLVPAGEIELKHTEFKRIPYLERAWLAERIARTLVDHGAFVSGFYRPAHSFVMEHVRDAVMYEEELPEDTSALYLEAVEELAMFWSIISPGALPPDTLRRRQQSPCAAPLRRLTR